MYKNFINVNFCLTKLGAAGFPDVPGNNILIEMNEKTFYTGVFGLRNSLTPNEIPDWMKSNPVIWPPGRIQFYIRTELNDHYAGPLEDIRVIHVGEFFNSRIHGPVKSWLRIGNHNLLADDFEEYNVSRPHTDFRPHGRLYITMPHGYISTSMLQIYPEDITIGDTSPPVQRVSKSNVRRRVAGHQYVS